MMPQFTKNHQQRLLIVFTSFNFVSLSYIFKYFFHFNKMDEGRVEDVIEEEFQPFVDKASASSSIYDTLASSK